MKQKDKKERLEASPVEGSSGQEGGETLPSGQSRREFLIRAGGVMAAVGGVAGGAALLHSNDPLRKMKGEGKYGPRSFRVSHSPGKPRAVWVKGGNAKSRMERALDELGGLGHFIKPRDRVLIKPNMAWDRSPAYAANTPPDVMEEMIKKCLDLNAKVTVAENPVNEAKLCAASSGIEAVCKKLGVPLLLPGEDDFVEADLEGKALTKWPVMRALYQTDKIIDMPIPKHHRLSRVTCALKNWLGIAGGRRMKLHQNIHETIVDLVAAFPPTLVFVDASKVLMRNGPTGGRMADVKQTDVTVAGLDAATIDVAVLPLLDAELPEARHITEAVARGLGTTDMGAMRRVSLG